MIAIRLVPVSAIAVLSLTVNAAAQMLGPGMPMPGQAPPQQQQAHVHGGTSWYSLVLSAHLPGSAGADASPVTEPGGRYTEGAFPASIAPTVAAAEAIARTSS